MHGISCLWLLETSFPASGICDTEGFMTGWQGWGRLIGVVHTPSCALLPCESMLTFALGCLERQELHTLTPRLKPSEPVFLLRQAGILSPPCRYCRGSVEVPASEDTRVWSLPASCGTLPLASLSPLPVYFPVAHLLNEVFIPWAKMNSCFPFS